MSSNQTTTNPIPSSRRRDLAMARLLTNIRQLMQLEPSDEIAMLIEQHTARLNSMYRHHATQKSAEPEQSSHIQSNVASDNAASESNNVQPADQSYATAPTSIEVQSTIENKDTETEQQLQPQQQSEYQPIIRLPRKLKKKLATLPPDHPLRKRYAAFSPLTIKP